MKALKFLSFLLLSNLLCFCSVNTHNSDISYVSLTNANESFVSYYSSNVRVNLYGVNLPIYDHLNAIVYFNDSVFISKVFSPFPVMQLFRLKMTPDSIFCHSKFVSNFSYKCLIFNDIKNLFLGKNISKFSSIVSQSDLIVYHFRLSEFNILNSIKSVYAHDSIYLDTSAIYSIAASDFVHINNNSVPSIITLSSSNADTLLKVTIDDIILNGSKSIKYK